MKRNENKQIISKSFENILKYLNYGNLLYRKFSKFYYMINFRKFILTSVFRHIFENFRRSRNMTEIYAMLNFRKFTPIKIS